MLGGSGRCLQGEGEGGRMERTARPGEITRVPEGTQGRAGRSKKDHPSRPVPSISSSRKIFLASGCAPAPKGASAHASVRLLHRGFPDPPNLAPDHLHPPRLPFPKPSPTTLPWAVAQGTSSTANAPLPPSHTSSPSSLLILLQWPLFQGTISQPSS